MHCSEAGLKWRGIPKRGRGEGGQVGRAIRQASGGTLEEHRLPREEQQQEEEEQVQ